MRIVNENLLLEDLVEKAKDCSDIEEAKNILFSVYLPSDNIKRAVEFCIKAHEGQFRKAGGAYATHPILVSSFVAFLSADESMIIAALLHDVIEDTQYGEDVVRKEFGNDVCVLVCALTKITEIREDKFSSKADKNLTKSALSFRNMLLTSISDVGVLVIKLCDRLHNMLTLDSLREDKQRRISEETLVVYAPIAHRLGISSLKNYLEDLSFKYLLPDEYKQIDRYINSNDQKMQIALNEFINKVELLFAQNRFRPNSFEIHKRVKHSYSVYLKMQRKGIGIEEVLDLLGIRILLENTLACYAALGILHTNFNPLVSRFKDYIALPKQNGYQTLHTTLFDTKNIIETQIRTFDMHKIAEFGIAAHWRYKEGMSASKPKLDWLNDISMQSANTVAKPENYSAIELYEYAKDSLYTEDIAVYSPKGEIFTLPRGATVLDFAYEVHTKVGLHAESAYVNRIKVPLLTELKNGDIVRIVTSNKRFYRSSWIDSVKTGKAKVAMKEFCKQKIREVNLQTALNILSSIFSSPKDEILSWIEKENLGKNIRRLSSDSSYLKDVVANLKKYAKKSYFFEKYDIKEQKFDNITVFCNQRISSVSFDFCCKPKKGDEIVAFVEASNVTLHNKLCDKADKFIEECKDMVFVEWNSKSSKSYKIIFTLDNKRGALAEFLTYLSRIGASILSINVNDERNELSNDYFETKVEFPVNSNINLIKERLMANYKILDFTSLDDAYNQ
ncbi:RelA/SpoT family protein [uncultured Campylobacter sp.]|uniref:RelA/SpoT family protein n=1 Tax=uncultured Campylobacter sp. TaxID=218934 RepID=UPI00260AD0B2|nr:RelA/SpoT family protein [uncultured Campylobacter sp.]